MHNLDAITTLGSTVPRVDQHGPIKLIEEPSFAMATIAARKNSERATKLAIRRIIGSSAPRPERFSGGTIVAFWIGPAQWMLEAPYNSHEMLFDLAKLEVKDNASVTEQSDGWCRFDMIGAGLAAVIELLCPINMNKFKFKFKMIRWRLGQLKLNLFHNQIQIKPCLESLNLLKVLSQSYPGYKVCGVWYKKIRSKTAKHNRTMPHSLTDFLNRKLTFMVNSNTTTKGYRT